MINQQPTLSVDKMKMSKFGFRMDLFNFSSDLSVFGIFVSIVGVIGGIALFFVASSVDLAYTGLPKLFYGAGAVTLILIMPYLAMWIQLKIKTSKQDIHGMEKIGKIYSYVTGSLEIIGMIVYFGMGIVSLVNHLHRLSADDEIVKFIALIVKTVLAVVYLIFACLKIRGIIHKKNKLLGAYIDFRVVLLFCLFSFSMGGIILTFDQTMVYGPGGIIALSCAFAFFVLDIGPTVILHTIRKDREEAAGIENV